MTQLPARDAEASLPAHDAGGGGEEIPIYGEEIASTSLPLVESPVSK